jgi:hypothetical protein
MMQVSKKILTIAFLVLVFTVPLVLASYETKASIISKYKTLCNQYPSLASFLSVGKSVQGRDIWLFGFGNSSGGRVLWDAQLHGNEDLGSETGYLFAQWLLTSSDTRAKYILAHNWVLIIPVVNIDGTGRTNAHHVNLNRNFVTGWGQSGSSSSSSSEYRGSSAGSEAETKVMRWVFQTYKPKWYINTHMYGGPRIYYKSAMSSSTISTLKSRMTTYAVAYGGRTSSYYPFTGIYGYGYAMADAYAFGAQSLLVEYGATTPPSYSQVTTTYYKDSRLLLIAVCSMCG